MYDLSEAGEVSLHLIGHVPDAALSAVLLGLG